MNYKKEQAHNSLCLLLLGLLAAALLILVPSFQARAAGTDISDCKITLSQKTFSYTGGKCAPEITVKAGTQLLKEGTDYTVYGASAVSVGKHEIILVGKGAYTGEASVFFQIKRARNKITLLSERAYETYSNPVTVYLRCSALGNPSLRYSTSTKGVSLTKDGVLKVKDGFLGTVKIKIRSAGTDTYEPASAVFSLKFRLKGTSITEIRNEGAIPDILPENDHTAKVIWNSDDFNIQNIDGFQIRYSRDRKFQSKVYQTKIPMLNAFGTIVNACSLSSHLTKGKTTYFQIRTYKTALDGKKYYSEWSDTVSHKVDSSAKSFYKGKEPKNGDTFDVNGIRYSYRNKELTADKLLYQHKSGQIVIPDTVAVYGKKYPVTAIKTKAFRNVTGQGSITSITIGKNVKKIGQEAFAANYFVKRITIKSTKLTSKTVGKKAFANTGRYSGSVKLSAPKSKRAGYRKILKNTGLTKKIIIV